jgi:hypothetical protein
MSYKSRVSRNSEELIYETSTLTNPWRYRIETANIFALPTARLPLPGDGKSTLLSAKECNKQNAKKMHVTVKKLVQKELEKLSSEFSRARNVISVGFE